MFLGHSLSATGNPLSILLSFSATSQFLFCIQLPYTRRKKSPRCLCLEFCTFSRTEKVRNRWSCFKKGHGLWIRRQHLELQTIVDHNRALKPVFLGHVWLCDAESVDFGKKWRSNMASVCWLNILEWIYNLEDSRQSIWLGDWQLTANCLWNRLDYSKWLAYSQNMDGINVRYLYIVMWFFICSWNCSICSESGQMWVEPD